MAEKLPVYVVPDLTDFKVRMGISDWAFLFGLFKLVLTFDHDLRCVVLLCSELCFVV